MGGRGKWSKPTANGFTWYDYHKVFQYRNTHYLVQHDHNDGGISAPVMSKTPNVTYVTLDKDGNPKSISVYKGRVKQYEIDLDKPHHGMQPHVHHCNEKGYRLGRESDEKMRLTKKMKEKVRVVMETFSRHKEALRAYYFAIRVEQVRRK